MKIEYTKVGDYYLPNLYYPEETRPIGCWGMFRKEYLKEHKSGTYTYLLLTARLDSYVQILCRFGKTSFFIHFINIFFPYKHTRNLSYPAIICFPFSHNSYSQTLIIIIAL